MSTRTLSGITILRFVIVLMLSVLVIRQGESQTFPDTQAVIEFQRAADAYAFSHRRTERRGAVPSGIAEGALFTPMVSAALQSRIRSAMANGCAVPVSGVDFEVPRAGASIGNSRNVPQCIDAALPRLPAELEYRRAGVALLLADAHLHIVVDVLHAAFPDVR